MQPQKATPVIEKDATPPQSSTDPKEDVKYSSSSGLVAFLARNNVSIAFTSYQSGLLYFLGRNKENGINVHLSAMPKPMGLTRHASGGLTLAAGFQILRFENVLDEGQEVNNLFDACYIPRRVHVTGQLDAHDVGLDAKGEPIFVNTRFNCLSRLSNRHSFEEVWRPPFISQLIDEDRCHLNGLAMRGGKPAFVSMISRSDTIDGWRDRRADGGVIMDVEKNEIMAKDLSMPHSPRYHNGELWVLNSGTGELGVVEGAETGKGEFVPKVFCPGFLRGLSFINNFAVVGLSKPRYQRFTGLALDQRLREADSEPWCGIQIIDLNTGRCAQWFRIDGKISELYDLEILPGTRTPMAVQPYSGDAAGLITFEGQFS